MITEKGKKSKNSNRKAWSKEDRTNDRTRNTEKRQKKKREKNKSTNVRTYETQTTKIENKTTTIQKKVAAGRNVEIGFDRINDIKIQQTHIDLHHCTNRHNPYYTIVEYTQLKTERIQN